MTKLIVTREEHRLAMTKAIDDHFALARFCFDRCPSEFVAMHGVVALSFSADSGWSCRKLASYALNELKWIEKERALTPTEESIRRIAERLYDAEKRTADRFGVDLFPEDKDREAARRQLEGRFQRAVEELRPFLTQGDNDDV